ncbi:hypothetical protein [Streptomyces sp. NPDC002540]
MPTPGPAEPASSANQRYQLLTLDALRRLVGNDWARLPGGVVLSRGVEGNLFSPLNS